MDWIGIIAIVTIEELKCINRRLKPSPIFFRNVNTSYYEVINMLFFDFASRRYFLKGKNNLINQLNELEERAQKGEELLWDDYYHAIGLPSMAFGKEPIARKEYGGIFEFELMPSEDCTVIYVNR